MSLAYEQFIRADDFAGVLAKCSDEISVFRAAYRKAGLPDFGARKSLKEILAWVLSALKRLKPKVTWTPSENMGQFELSFANDAQGPPTESKGGDARMPLYIDGIALSLEQVLIKADLYLWLMVDRLDELVHTAGPGTQGLLRALRLFRSDRILVKVFLRDDILDQIVGGREGLRP